MSGAKRTDVRYKPVVCADCGRSYECTPFDDYYEATTATDGCCIGCLLARNGFRRTARVVMGVVRTVTTEETQ